MVTAKAKQYPWALVGPWYRAESVGGPPAGRATAPIFQKYAATDFANRIVKEPQASLKFNCEDFIHRICLNPDQLVTPEMRESNQEPLKFFLDVQSRFYVVVCELHCVAPGFPSVDREQVCEAGFVVRRRVPNVPQEARDELTTIMHERNLLKSQVLRISGGQQISSNQPPVTIGGLVKDKFDNMVDSFKKSRITNLLQQLDNNSQRLKQLGLKYDLSLFLEGWLPSEHDGVGAWVNVEAFPETLTEYVFPLYPLISDPSNTTHSATGKTMYFGVVPTASSMVDNQGNPIFDEDDLYELQCFVRRHNPACTKKQNESDCSGEIVWSKPTESYRLASFYDLDGGNHKPINIKLPDLNALKNQADLGPPGRGVNVRMIAPAGSMLKFDTNEMDMPTNTSRVDEKQICFFAIFLFFIVAMFLFQLFLPIVLFLFQLWFLLKLKFCIPPTIEFGADLAVELKVKGPEIEAKFDLDASFEIEVGGQVFTNANKDDLKDLIIQSISDEVNADPTFKAKIQEELQDSLNLDELADLYISMKTDYSDDPVNEELAGNLPAPDSGLVYFQKVARA